MSIYYCQVSLLIPVGTFLFVTHGFHFFRLTNFPDFSSIFCSFPVLFKVLFYLKYDTIFTGFSLLLADKFPRLFQYFPSVIPVSGGPLDQILMSDQTAIESNGKYLVELTIMVQRTREQV